MVIRQLVIEHKKSLKMVNKGFVAIYLKLAGKMQNKKEHTLYIPKCKIKNQTK